MRRFLNRIFLLLFIITCVSTLQPPLYAQEATQEEQLYQSQSRQVPPEQWNELTREKDFSYRDKKEWEQPVQAKKEKKPTSERSFKFIESIIKFFTSDAGVVLLYVIIFAIALWVIYKVVIGERSSLFGRKSRQLAVSQEIIEEDILEVNWQQRLNDATAKGDLRLAIRFAYMWGLQLLQENQLINYRIDKTNYDYLNELQDDAHKQPFRKLTRQYEYAWYGHYEVSNSSYEEFQREFQSFKTKLGS